MAHHRGIGVRRDGDPPIALGQARASQAEQRGVPAGTLDRVQEQLVVILAVDPAGVAQEPEEIGAAVARGRQGVGPVESARGEVRRRRQRSFQQRRLGGERGRRDVGQDLAARPVEHPQAAGRLTVARQARRLGHDPDHTHADLPAVTEGLHGRPRLGGDDGQHPLLALARHHLPRRHRLLAQRHGREVDVDADPAARRRLAGGADEAGPAEVLDPDDQPVVEQRQAGLDQPLLLEGIAHLHAGSLGVVLRARSGAAEARRREHAHAADAVAAGRRAQEHDQVARARGASEHESFHRQRAETEHVHEGVPRVGGIEGQLAADRRDADGVAVARDAGHDTLEQPPLARIVERPEEQRVHHRQRTGAHREDVAQDAPHAGGRPLVGLDCRGVVVALDTDGDRDAIARVHDAGILPRSDEHPWTGRGEAAQVDTRRLVGAVLAPHDGKERQFQAIGGPAQDLGDGLILAVTHAKCPVERLGLGASLHGLTVAGATPAIGQGDPSLGGELGGVE